MSKRKKKRNRFRNLQKEKKLKLSERRQQEFRAQIAKLQAERILYLPLDIGKNVHWFRADSGAGRNVHLPQPLTTDQVGYTYWQQCLRSYLSSGHFDLIVLGYEPTGVYHETWSRAILTDFEPFLDSDSYPSLRYRSLNPYQVKLEREKITMRPSKNDPLDLRAMLALLQQGQGNPVSLPDPHTALLRQYVYFARKATAELKAARNDLLRQLDRIWPGAVVNVRRFKRAHPNLPVPQPIVSSRPFERLSLRCLLDHCPNPYRIQELGIQGIIDLFHQNGYRCGHKTAQRILDCAQRALPNPPQVVEVFCLGLQQLLVDEQHWLARRQWAEQHLETITRHTPARHLLSIRGMSPTWAAFYLDLVGSPPHFDWPDQVWAYVGFDPIEKQSGDSKKVYKISRHGEAFHRHTLTWMTNLVAGHHPTFGQFFIQAEERGMGLWKASIHTAHKLHRVCFKLLLEERPYIDHTHPDDFARWRAYWLAYRQHRARPKHKPHPGPWRPTR
jgi:transposase